MKCIIPEAAWGLLELFREVKLFADPPPGFTGLFRIWVVNGGGPIWSGAGLLTVEVNWSQLAVVYPVVFPGGSVKPRYGSYAFNLNLVIVVPQICRYQERSWLALGSLLTCRHCSPEDCSKEAGDPLSCSWGGYLKIAPEIRRRVRYRMIDRVLATYDKFRAIVWIKYSKTGLAKKQYLDSLFYCRPFGTTDVRYAYLALLEKMAFRADKQVQALSAFTDVRRTAAMVSLW